MKRNRNIIKLLLVSFILLHAPVVFAQKLQVDVMGGLANYLGDLQYKKFTFQKAQPALGLGLSYEVLPKFSIRGQYMYTSLQASDANSPRAGQRQRNLSFYTKISEVSLLGQYDILSVENRRLTPYLFAGVGYFHFNPYAFDSSGSKVYLHDLGTEGQGLPQYPDRKKYSLNQINIPFGGGLKFVLSDKVSVSGEFSVRYLFTDYIDDVSKTYPNKADLLAGSGPLAVAMSFRGDELKPPLTYPDNGQRGNSHANDYYYTGVIKISYKFGSSGGGSYYAGGKRRHYRSGCPSTRGF